jgi:hypothetical protein
MNYIIELKQTKENNWKARYQGNYGIYTIKITFDGNKVTKYSCSCPSDYYPCKHISMIKEAIVEQLTINKKVQNKGGLQIEDVIKSVSVEKLRKFIINQAKYDIDFYNAVLLEFAANTGNTKINIYSGIISKALESFSYDEDEIYYSEAYQDIEALDLWLDKAQDYLHLKKYNEAVLICQAIIEEYSKWLYNIETEITEYFKHEYQSTPFKIINEAIEHIDKKELFNYCLLELKNEKYNGTYFYDNFHDTLAKLAVTVEPDTFIALQDELFAKVKDKNSYIAERILKRKIKFYKQTGQIRKAWAVINENLQIESFCLKLVERKINRKEYTIAKTLINDFVDKQKKDTNRYLKEIWGELLLLIAQKENDIPAIRNLAFGFIKDYYKEKYYKIYKSTFSPAEWADEFEKLFLHYNKKSYGDSAANLLAAENEAKRLIEYIEKKLSIEELEKYYKIFAPDYPEKTLKLFKKALIRYAEHNVGRSYYENILVSLRRMSNVKGGKEAAMELVKEFKEQYKIRRAMMEILGRFK